MRAIFSLSVYLSAWMFVANPLAQAAVVAHLPLNDGSPSATAADASGNGHTGTLTNMVPASDWTTGVLGGALDFNNTTPNNDYVVVADHSQLDFGAGNFTVSFWVNKRAATTSGHVNLWGVNKWNTGASPGTNEWSLTLGHSNAGNTDEPTFAIQSGTTSFVAQSNVALTLNQWHHLAGVRRGSVIELYQDGVLTATAAVGTAAVNNVGRDLRIANSALNSLMPNAIFDDVGLLDHAWEAGEVSSVVSLALNGTLNYDLSQAQLLFDLHDTMSDAASVTIGGRTWRYITGLTGSAGSLSQIGSDFFLKIDSAGTGVTTYVAPIPEPGTLSLLLIGSVAMVARRRRTAA